jgi:hypothetical protein
MEILKDQRGQIIGRIDESATGLTYMDKNGRVVARYFESGDYTLDGRGQNIGKGDQGMIELGRHLN